jgi:methylmalonyl-CoA/ethylmalonyl-CoA epimerase
MLLRRKRSRTMLEGVGQIALNVRDVERSQAFYGETLGLLLLYRYGHLVFFSAGNLRLMLSGGQPPTPSTSCLYFKVADLEAAFVTLRERGVAFQKEPHVIARMPDHELWMAFFQDPDGHQLALMTEKRD